MKNIVAAVAVLSSTGAAFGAGWYFNQAETINQLAELRTQRDIALHSAHTALELGHRALIHSNDNMQTLQICLLKIGLKKPDPVPPAKDLFDDTSYLANIETE